MRRFFKRSAKFDFWRNPDGSVGGEVSERAEVDPTAVIEPYATVLSGARIPAGAVVRNGEIAMAGGDVISFGSHGGHRQLTSSQS